VNGDFFVDSTNLSIPDRFTAFENDCEFVKGLREKDGLIYANWLYFIVIYSVILRDYRTV